MMLVLVDDIKLNDEAEFLEYIRTELKQKEIKDLNDLSRFLYSTDDEIELILSDYDEAKNSELASKVMQIFSDTANVRSNIKLTKM